MPQITKQDYDWLKSHKEHITQRNRGLRYVATFLLWLGISIGNYYLLTSFTAITWSVGILLFGFEIALFAGTYYALCKLSYKEPDFAFALATISFFAFFAFTLAIAADPALSALYFSALIIIPLLMSDSKEV